jgi:hypothetical protein
LFHDKGNVREVLTPSEVSKNPGIVPFLGKILHCRECIRSKVLTKSCRTKNVHTGQLTKAVIERIATTLCTNVFMCLKGLFKPYIGDRFAAFAFFCEENDECFVEIITHR